ncbi:MAG: hypothetical protein IT510_03270 [Sulfuritalea sp.]|jgi:hypothetical protein|nr:hypothetical protein [Sulfuritalea sp.]
MRNLTKATLTALLLVAAPAMAQQAPVGAKITENAPGKVAMAEGVKVSALVTAIDKATRTVTLKGPQGNSFDVVAGDAVKNFAQIKVNDEVVVEYVRALTLEVKKSNGPASRTDSADAVRAKPGQKPAGAVGRQVTIVADVIDVNPAAKTITVKGPKGNVVELEVKNPDHFKVVKKGDQIEANYVEAAALSVEPAKKAAKK